MEITDNNYYEKRVYKISIFITKHHRLELLEFHIFSVIFHRVPEKIENIGSVKMIDPIFVFSRLIKYLYCVQSTRIFVFVYSYFARMYFIIILLIIINII